VLGLFLYLAALLAALVVVNVLLLREVARERRLRGGGEGRRPNERLG
jgi:hypothetical protein